MTGRAAATFMTLIASAQRNGHNPSVYLTDLPQLLPDAWTPTDG